MRKILLSIFATFFSIFICFLALPEVANAESRTIYLATAANRNYQGELINKNFEKSLAARIIRFISAASLSSV